MAKIIDCIKGISAYPIPQRTIEESAVRRGLDTEATATAAMLTSSSYRLVKADMMMWVAAAPNISQGGQYYSITDSMRNSLKNEAAAIYEEEGEPMTEGTYGYKGEFL